MTSQGFFINEDSYSEFKKLYLGLTSWINNEESRQELEDILFKNVKIFKGIAVEQTIEDKPFEEQKEELVKVLEEYEDIDLSLNSYSLKFIVAHIVVYFTRSISSEGIFEHSFYNASNKIFLRNFILGVTTKYICPKPTDEEPGKNISPSQLLISQILLSALEATVYTGNPFEEIYDCTKYVNDLCDDDSKFDEYLTNFESKYPNL